MWKLPTRKSKDLWRFDSDLSDQTQRRFGAGEHICPKSIVFEFSLGGILRSTIRMSKVEKVRK